MPRESDVNDLMIPAQNRESPISWVFFTTGTPVLNRVCIPFLPHRQGIVQVQHSPCTGTHAVEVEGGEREAGRPRSRVRGCGWPSVEWRQEIERVRDVMSNIRRVQRWMVKTKVYPPSQRLTLS